MAITVLDLSKEHAREVEKSLLAKVLGHPSRPEDDRSYDPAGAYDRQAVDAGPKNRHEP
jgi:hypothetical protein